MIVPVSRLAKAIRLAAAAIKASDNPDYDPYDVGEAESALEELLESELALEALADALTECAKP